jgi:hypothetical protein
MLEQQLVSKIIKAAIIEGINILNVQVIFIIQNIFLFFLYKPTSLVIYAFIRQI